MKFRLFPVAALLIAAAGCNQAQTENELNNSAPTPTGNAPAPPPIAPQPPAPAPAQENGTETATPPSLPEPKGPIDPKSAEAAGQVVQHYGALIEQHRMAEAAKLWGSAEAAQQFALQLKRYPDAHLEIGKPGGMEGAAGSSYVTVPVFFYGKDRNGGEFRRAADIILRRVNDVPGSSEAQRRWHIERIEWKDAG